MQRRSNILTLAMTKKQHNKNNDSEKTDHNCIIKTLSSHTKIKIMKKQKMSDINSTIFRAICINTSVTSYGMEDHEVQKAALSSVEFLYETQFIHTNIGAGNRGIDLPPPTPPLPP
ncbi:MAG: hypothetical protein U5L02_18385 [Rheinheimera sp.]|nr:hypothetical protein [Rheinheimera sp.]